MFSMRMGFLRTTAHRAMMASFMHARRRISFLQEALGERISRLSVSVLLDFRDLLPQNLKGCGQLCCQVFPARFYA